MNRKVTNRFFMGLCISFGLMACSQELQQNKYENLVVGLVGDEINLYPLGESLSFYVYPAGTWELDCLNYSGISIAKYDDSTIRLSADALLEGDDRNGIFRIENDFEKKKIEFNQEPVSLKVFKGGDEIENKGIISAAGQTIDFTVETNVFYDVSIDPDTVKVNIADSAFSVVDTAKTRLNGDDINRTIKISLCNKNEKILPSYEDYFWFTLHHKADIFKWTDGDVEPMKQRDFEFDFNDKDGRTVKFISSGKWEIKQDAGWIDVTVNGQNGVNSGEAGDFNLNITVKPNEDDQQRGGRVSLTHEGWVDSPLIINVTQKNKPKIELSNRTLSLVEKGEAKLNVSVTGRDYFDVIWTVDSDKVELSPSEGKEITVKAISEGTAEVSALVQINGQDVATCTCYVTVIREYGGGTGEEIEDDKGEW